MVKKLIVAVLVLLVVVIGGAAVAEDTHPPHRERPVAGASVPLAAVGGDHPGDVIVFVEGVDRALWIRGVEEARAVERARSSVRPAVVGGGIGGDCAQLSAQLGLSEAILWRESRCTWGAYNVGGCGGRGCIGPAQVDLGHFAPVSPWNGNVPGTCADLDPNDPKQYAECVGRLPASAWG